MPRLGGLARVGGWFIERGMRRNTPADFHDRVVIVRDGDLERAMTPAPLP